MDLWNTTAAKYDELIKDADDPVVREFLVRMQHALVIGDSSALVEATGDLSDYITLSCGNWGDM